MLFTHVIFSTYEFSHESFANAKLTPSSFMSKNGVVFKTTNLSNNYDRLLKLRNNICLLKEFFFTSPQLKITLFNAVFLQLALMCLFNRISDNFKRKLIQREADVPT